MGNNYLERLNEQGTRNLKAKIHLELLWNLYYFECGSINRNSETDLVNITESQL